MGSAFGYQAAGIDLALKGGYGQDRPYLWATEFENVHTNFDFQEPSVMVSGKQYACSEDAYHAQKPEPFDETVWDKCKVNVMQEAVLSKFQAVGATGDSLRELLLSTHPHPLLAIKGDTFWGFHPAKGGENMLGVLLMRIREDMASAMWAWHRGNTIGETPTFAAPVPAAAAAAPTFEHITSTEKQDVMDKLFGGDWPCDKEPTARAPDAAQLEEEAHAGGVSMLNLSELNIMELGGVEAVQGGGQQATRTFSHMAMPSRKPTVRDVDACSAKHTAGEAAACGDQKSCYNFSEGDIVEVTWGKRQKRTKYAATVLAIDHSKKAKPVHVTFGPAGNAWVSAESVVKHTNAGGTAFTPPAPGLHGLRTLAAGGLAARAELVYRGSQHCRSNEAVGKVPGSGPYGIDPRTQKAYLATYAARHGVEPPASNMTAVPGAIGGTGLLAGGVGGVKGSVEGGTKPDGYEVRLQGGVTSVFEDYCGMCGKVGSRNRELTQCRWTPPAGWLHPELTNYLAGFVENKCTVNKMQWRGPKARGAAATRPWAKCSA